MGTRESAGIQEPQRRRSGNAVHVTRDKRSGLVGAGTALRSVAAYGAVCHHVELDKGQTSLFALSMSRFTWPAETPSNVRGHQVLIPI